MTPHDCLDADDEAAFMGCGAKIGGYSAAARRPREPPYDFAAALRKESRNPHPRKSFTPLQLATYGMKRNGRNDAMPASSSLSPL